jgi:hypothetical protein
MHNRPNISEIFCESINRIKRKYIGVFEIKCVASVSDEASYDVCIANCVQCVRVDNESASKKWNTAAMYAMTLYPDFDYVCIMGDDDIMHDNLFEHYKRFIFDGVDYFGVDKVYFYDSVGKKSMGYTNNSGSLIGCGRMISMKAFKKAGFECLVSCNVDIRIGDFILNKNETVYLPQWRADYLINRFLVEQVAVTRFALWGTNLMSGLDNYSELKLFHSGYVPQVVKINEAMITDIKSEQNIWSFDKLKSFGICEDVENDCALNILSVKEKQMLK